MSPRHAFRLIGVLLLSFGLAGCEATKIGNIVADPGSYMNKEIAITGTVITSSGLLGKGFYEVDDGTGRLWVIAESRGVPSKGTRVGVKGRVVTSITILGTNYATAMRESARRAEKDGR